MSDESNEQRRELLRAGDPAAGDPGLDRGEQAAMRARLVVGARRRRPPAWLVPATAAAALFALTLGLAWRSAPAPEVIAQRPAAPPAPGERQIQFTTDRGTLVVWVLEPRSNR